MTFESRTITMRIDCDPGAVYAFMSDPQNLPRWASGLGKSVTRSGNGWLLETADGPVGFRYVPENPFGVLDHYVTPALGAEVYVPMRVVPNGTGCEVLLTVFLRPGMGDEDFERDAAMVKRDLEKLKRLMER